jgi:AraC-like DNA-binding protein
VTGPESSWITEQFETRDPDELLGYLNRHTGTSFRKITPLGRKCDFRFSRNEMNFGRLRLTEAFSSSVRFYGPGSPTRLSLIVSKRGQSLIKVGKLELVSNSGDAAITTTGTAEGFLESSPVNTRFIVQVPRSEFLAQFQISSGTKTTALGNGLQLDLTAVGKQFHRVLNFIWHQQAPPNELLRAAYDEILLHGVVSLFEPVLGGEMPKQTDPGPAHVHRACELIRARVAEPIRISEIARELGISPRHLQSGFRRHLGMTPHRFLRDCRLDEAHRLLSAAGPGHTTTSIAYDCGFGHLSDFAHDYRSRFGESPSETLRRSRS